MRRQISSILLVGVAMLAAMAACVESADSEKRWRFADVGASVDGREHDSDAARSRDVEDCEFEDKSTGVCAHADGESPRGTCSPPPGFEAKEKSFDGLDNDCDGLADNIVESVSAGVGTTCVVTTGGKVTCWGYAKDRQLPSPSGSFRQFVAEGAGFCGLTKTGHLRCWEGVEGKLEGWSPPMERISDVGIGSGHLCVASAVGEGRCWGDDKFGISTPPSDDFAGLDAGLRHTCGTTDRGRIRCWGLGTDPDESEIPYNPGGGSWRLVWDKDQAVAPRGTYESVTAGWEHSCGLTDSGTVKCWGRQEEGVSDAPSERMTQVTAGAAHTCGLTVAGTVTCWGVGSESGIVEGHLGTTGRPLYDAKFFDFDQAVPPKGTFVQIDAGGAHTCAVAPDRTLECWGNDGHGQSTLPPGRLHGLSVGPEHVCGLEEDSTVTCWGNNEHGETDAADGAFTLVRTGGRHTCALEQSGGVECWGENRDGESVPLDGEFVDLASGEGFSCGLRPSNKIECWGRDFDRKTKPPSGTYTRIDAGSEVACALKPNGETDCWRFVGNGEIETPPERASKISVGGYHGCLLMEDGSVECWRFGTDSDGGAPDTKRHKGPFREVSAGAYHTCALGQDGAIECWGSDEYGQASPPSGTFVEVDSGQYQSCAIRQSGALTCWGRMVFGQ